MAISKELREFINSPDVLDFIARGSDYLSDFVMGNPNVVVTQTLLGRYEVGYIHKDYYSQLVRALGTSLLSSTPVVLGTLDRPPLEAAGVIQVHNQPYLDLKGQGRFNWLCRYGNRLYTADLYPRGWSQ